MKILILAPNYIDRTNWCHQLWRNEIARQHDVVFHGQGHDLNSQRDVRKIVEAHGPFDVITVGENPRHFHYYIHLEKCEAYKVCFVSDYWGDKEIAYDKLLHQHGIDMVCFPTPDFLAKFNAKRPIIPLPRGIFSLWLSHIQAVDLTKYKWMDQERGIDVACVLGLSDSVYPKRPELQRLVGELPYKTVVGNWTKGNYKRERYIELLNRCKIFVSVGGIDNQMTMKFMEAMACGTLFLTDKPEDMDHWGLEDGKHLVCYKDFKDMREKIDYYLSHDTERAEICRNGRVHVESNYSMKEWVTIWTTLMEAQMGKRRRVKYSPVPL
jgi:glycosyltransferase involved in cell wall biosynthesis